MDHARRPTLMQRHVERVEHQPGSQVVRHGPSRRVRASSVTARNMKPAQVSTQVISATCNSSGRSAAKSTDLLPLSARLARQRINPRRGRPCPAQLRIAWDEGSNSRDGESGVRPERTKATICSRNSCEYGRLVLGIVETSCPKDQVPTKSGQLQIFKILCITLAVRILRRIRANLRLAG